MPLYKRGKHYLIFQHLNKMSQLFSAITGEKMAERNKFKCNLFITNIDKHVCLRDKNEIMTKNLRIV